MYCLGKFHTWIWAHRDVTVYTDHRPLVHLLRQTSLSHSLQSWLDIILTYDLKIKYRPGIMNVLPDWLSRMYEQTYRDKPVWGVRSTIEFLDNVTDIMVDAASSDAKVIDSLQYMAPTERKARKYQAARQLVFG